MNDHDLAKKTGFYLRYHHNFWITKSNLIAIRSVLCMADELLAAHVCKFLQNDFEEKKTDE